MVKAVFRLWFSVDPEAEDCEKKDEFIEGVFTLPAVPSCGDGSEFLFAGKRIVFTAEISSVRWCMNAGRVGITSNLVEYTAEHLNLAPQEVALEINADIRHNVRQLELSRRFDIDNPTEFCAAWEELACELETVGLELREMNLECVNSRAQGTWGIVREQEFLKFLTDVNFLED
ncbi:MAG TPA: hypothetical protein VEB60_02730 [Candidatus Paceibacterota bacterium]|nr:hypothetical protein [Candidatus Paceibacterota bacterium]